MCIICNCETEKLVRRWGLKDFWKSHINASLLVFEDGMGDMLFCTKDRLHLMLWLWEKVLILSLGIFLWRKQTPHLLFLFFFAISRFSCPPPIFNISLFLSSGSTLSANSCLSAAQKWLCLADSTDKRLNACCPQKRRRRGKGRENRGVENMERWGNWERIRITITLLWKSQLG